MAKIFKSYLKNINFYNSFFWRSNLSNNYLFNVNLSNADLRETKIFNSYLKNVNLSNSFLWKSTLSNNYLFNVNLSATNLKDSYLFNIVLVNVKLKGACSTSLICNKPLILRVGKKADLSGIKNETLTEEKIEEILELIKERVDEEDYKNWKDLLYQFKGKTTLDWIKAQNVDLGVFTEEDYKEHIRSIASTEEDVKKFIEKERQELEERREKNYISQQEYEKYLNLLNKIEKEMIEEYRKKKEETKENN
jgi:hypothetical protein